PFKWVTASPIVRWVLTCTQLLLPEEDQQRLLFEGGYPVLAKVAKRKGLPYPHVNEQGEVEADAAWWATMQAAK
ncbi:hypothetical protein V7P28_13910, partial [Klebsiella michiganensis]